MKIIYSNIAVLSTVLWIGAQSAVVTNEKPSCGFPRFNKRKDKGVFLWNKCNSTQWFLQAVGGKQPITVEGTLVSDEDIELNKNFTINVAKRAVGGINFKVKKGSTCLTIKHPEDVFLYGGKDRMILPKSFSLPNFKPCNGPLLEYRFDTEGSAYQDTGEKGWDGSKGRNRGRISISNEGFARSAVALDGMGNHVLIPESKKLTMKAYTMMAWVRYSDNSRPNDVAYAIIQKSSAVWLNINKKSHRVKAGGFFGGCDKNKLFQVESIKEVPTVSWTHIAAVNDGDTLKIYINGELDAEGKLSTSGEYCSNQAPFNIGSGYGETPEQDKNFFKGHMDSVRVYDKDLSQDDIRSEMFRNEELGQCLQPYTELSNANRNVNFNDGKRGVTICDQRSSSDWMGGWHRFVGDAGTQMPETAPPRYSCGTHAPGWLNGTHPIPEDGVVNRNVCFHWTEGKCEWRRSIQVLNCGGFYLYNIDRAPTCSLRYCGETV